MATVLIIATEQMIGGLLGQLTDLTGHAPRYREAGEEASAAVRSVRPDIVLLDAAYARATLDLVAAAAGSVGARVVYFSSTLPANELRRFALGRGARYFALPAGPKLLARVLASALEADGFGQAGVASTASLEHAVAAAAAAMAQARKLAARAAEIRSESRALRSEREAALAACRRSHAELRDAVIAYTRELRHAGVPPERTLELVKNALRVDSSEVTVTSAVEAGIDDAVEWCLQAYYAA